MGTYRFSSSISSSFSSDVFVDNDDVDTTEHIEIRLFFLAGSFVQCALGDGDTGADTICSSNVGTGCASGLGTLKILISSVVPFSESGEIGTNCVGDGLTLGEEQAFVVDNGYTSIPRSVGTTIDSSTALVFVVSNCLLISGNKVGISFSRNSKNSGSSFC